jgi:hypothetical protein
MTRIIHHNSVDIVSRSRNGAWNDSFLRTKLPRPNIKDQGLSTLLDQSTKLVGGNTVCIKLTDK